MIDGGLRFGHALLLRGALIASAGLVFGACEPVHVTETASFEEAEVAYRQGHYASALDGYERFVARYPSSPLAEVAELRIRAISREIQSMLGRTKTPPPLYRGAAESAIKKGALKTP